MDLIDKKKFAKAALSENINVFVLYMSSLSLRTKMSIHPAWDAQIALFIAKKVTVPAKYSDFTDIFSRESAEVLPKRIGMNKHAIELEDAKQSPYRPIYSLGPVELEILKIYIKTNLANNFIQPLKSPAGAPILFVCKPDGNFQLCLNYWGLNNMTMENQYPLPLIGGSLDGLGQAKLFT